MDYIIDAKNKKLGRLASEIALILQGKKKPSYEKQLVGEDRVILKNIKLLDVGAKKFKEKVYYRHSGPLGHLKKKEFPKLFSHKPEWILQHAVRLMLPKNRLQKPRLKRMIIER